MRELLIACYVWGALVTGALYRDDYARVNLSQATALQTVVMAAGWPIMGIFLVGPALMGGSFFSPTSHESTKTR